ncbi:MAG: helix-turn-helix domain-containing protein [Solirubrobacteraceae bacterium]
MSVRVSTWAWTTPVGGSAKLVLLALADQANDAGVCWPGQNSLADRCGIRERMVRNHLASLEADGYIKRERRHRSDGARTSDLYTLTLPADFAGRAGDHRQNLHRLPAVSGTTNRQDIAGGPLKAVEPSGEPSGETAPARKFARFDKAMQR